MLKAIVEAVDSVPEPVREFYVKDEESGKFRLNVEPVDGFALEDVNGLKTVLSDHRTKLERTREKLKAFEGIEDPIKAREALAKLEELASIDPSKEADKIANEKFEAAKKQLVEGQKKAIDEFSAKLQTRERMLDGYARRQEAIAAIAEAKGSVELLLPHVLNQTSTEITDEGVVVKVLDVNGSQKFNTKGGEMTIKELVAEMRQNDIYARAFEASGQGGGGKPPNSNAGGAGTLKRSQMTNAQKAEYVGKHGQEAFLKLPR